MRMMGATRMKSKMKNQVNPFWRSLLVTSAPSVTVTLYGLEHAVAMGLTICALCVILKKLSVMPISPTDMATVVINAWPMVLKFS